MYIFNYSKQIFRKSSISFCTFFNSLSNLLLYFLSDASETSVPSKKSMLSKFFSMFSKFLLFGLFRVVSTIIDSYLILHNRYKSLAWKPILGYSLKTIGIMIDPHE